MLVINKEKVTLSYQFKKEVKALAMSEHVTFSNFESIIPGEYWGLKQSTKLGGQPEYDFMHFSSVGHSLLAKALDDRIQQMIKE